MSGGLYLLDLEASGLHDDSYPTEVAWCSHDLLAGASYLIRPTAEWLTTPWSAEAETITGITLAMLAEHGLPAEMVADRLNADLGGADPLTDHPWGDGRWLRLLFDAAGVEPSFGICPAPPPNADITGQSIWNASKGMFDIDVVVAGIANRSGLSWQVIEDETARLKAAAGLIDHRALDDAIAHGLQLGLVVVMTTPGAAVAHDLTALVERAKALKAKHGRADR